MSRYIDIQQGDYGQQRAEYTLIGLQQKPALSLRKYSPRRGLFGFMRKKWRPEIVEIENQIARIEKLQEGYFENIEKEWGLPGVDGKKRKGDIGKMLQNFSATPSSASSRQVKKIQFQLWFKDGTQFTATADARVFQNILAVVGS